MKKLLLALLLNCTALFADQAVIGCKILLDKNEYTHHNGDLDRKSVV